MDRSHSDWREMVPHSGFDLQFSDNEWCWASFHVFVSHLWFFFNFCFLATSCNLQDLSSPTQGHGSEKCQVLTTGSPGKCLSYLFHFPISDYFWFSDFIFVLKVEGIGIYILHIKLCVYVYIYICAAAKSLQSCPTLCDPIDGSPPGSTVPGILQARTLEWIAISFSDAWKWKVKVKSLSRVRLLVIPWTAAYQAPPSMGFSRQEYWSGVPLPSPIALYI